MKKTLLFSLTSLFAFSSFADDISLGTPSYGGNGCPQGSASVALSPNNKALTILFDKYVVNAGGETGKVAARKTCNIGVPVHVPAGMTVSLLKIDYRGFVNLPLGAYSQFNVEYFFAGSTGPRYEKIFVGEHSDNYTLHNEIMAQSMIWSPCGKDIIVRANTSMFVKTSMNYAEAMATVDSADVDAGIVYHLAWNRC